MSTFTKRWIDGFILAFSLIFFQRLVLSQTGGFSPKKIQSEPLFYHSWQLPEQAPPSSLLQQPFYFLGHGTQSYAFIGADQTTVLKVFKQYRGVFPSHWIATLPWIKDWVLPKRKERIFAIFSSLILAHTSLCQQTGSLYLHLSPSIHVYPVVEIYDKLGFCHKLNLTLIPFMLQKKAEPFFLYLGAHPEKIEKVIDSLFSLISRRSHLGIMNQDPVLRRNFGICEEEVVELDVGSFSYNEELKRGIHVKQELFYEVYPLKEWLAKSHPEKLAYFERKLQEYIESS